MVKPTPTHPHTAMFGFDDRRSHNNNFTQGTAVEARRISSNLPFILGSLVMLLIVGLVGFLDPMAQGGVSGTTPNTASNVGEYISGGSGGGTTTSGIAVKPYIYQFDFVSQPRPQQQQTPPSPSSTSNNVVHPGTRRIPYVWSQVWESAGWTPMMLEVNNYPSSKEYQEILNLLEPNCNSLQKIHVYKYLAMAASGGGWLAHSDTFPLHPFGSSLQLPNDGKFTAYGGPWLVSASANEWLRMGKLVANHARNYQLRDQWTEAFALLQMQHVFIMQKDEVFETPNVATAPNDVQWSWNPNDCQTTKTKRAVHFQVGDREVFSTIADPSDMIIKWLSMWLQSCEKSTYFVDQEHAGMTESPGQSALVQVGSFHTPENYDGTNTDATTGSTLTTSNESVQGRDGNA